jgi:hypothetical protein
MSVFSITKRFTGYFIRVLPEIFVSSCGKMSAPGAVKGSGKVAPQRRDDIQAAFRPGNYRGGQPN